MCLILIAWHVHPEYPLILGANRDEFYDRPSASAEYWEENPEILAGKDLKEGGTWLGINADGYVAALTNYRDLKKLKPDAKSRGHLVSDFLKGKESPENYLKKVQEKADQYNGFNLICGNLSSFSYYSNTEDKIVEVEPGIHGISNHLMNTAWPKVIAGKLKLDNLLKEGNVTTGNILEIMYDETTPPDQDLPDTGVGMDIERLLSPMFIVSNGYGTRCSTAILINNSGKVVFEEKTFSLHPKENIIRRFDFQLRK